MFHHLQKSKTPYSVKCEAVPCRLTYSTCKTMRCKALQVAEDVIWGFTGMSTFDTR